MRIIYGLSETHNALPPVWGMRLVWQYAKLGALWPAVKAGVRCLVKGQSFKGIYPEVLRKIEPYLVKRYAQVLQSKKEEVRCKSYKEDHPKIIWWCWLQGLDEAPQIVKACYNSLKQLTGYSLVVISNTNWREYVELPGYIVEKWEKGRIPAAMFSDLLRVELLIKYGGTWIDSTVLCTGVNDNHNDNDNSKYSKLATDSKLYTLNSKLKQYMNAPLFVFQYTPEGTTENISISNWFITAHSNNEVLMTLRDMLFAYWKDYNCTLDYYMFHLFFTMVAKEYPEQVAAMPYGYSMNSLVLLHHLNEGFDQKKWDKLISKVCFHKLAFRLNGEIINNKDNYYN